MNVSAIFIRRPIATSLLMLAIALFGVISYQSLPVSDLPNVDFPTLVISATLPGASPDTMASSVATPLERQFTGIAGLDSMTSVSSMGGTSVTLQFDLTRDLDGAAVDVQTAISEVMPLLPPGMPNPPSFRKVNPADSPVLYMGVTSDSLPLYVLDEYAETVVAQRISTVPGVAQVQVMGAQKYAVHVQVDPSKLAAKQLGINELDTAIQNWNVNLPIGTLYGPKQQFNLQASGQLNNAEAYKPMIVAWRNGAPVRLDQVARVIDSVEEERSASWLVNRKGAVRAITLTAYRQPGSNTIEVNDAIKRLLPVFQAQLPPAVKLSVRGDRSKTIRDSFGDIRFTMVVTFFLVVGVIFLFLRNVSATLIPSLALPFSIIGTFAVMYLLDYSLDNLSMMALILSVGFVVDDAIVMLENIMRHIERGEAPMAAAFAGSREISFTIVSMTVSLAAVFIPVLFMGGILGRLFREFAVTICAAILISGVVSITLTPMLCSRLLRSGHGKQPGLISRGIEWVFDWILAVYAGGLRWVLRRRPLMLAVFVLVLGATVYLYTKVPKGFIPDQDNDMMFCSTEAAQGTAFDQMVIYQKKLAEIIAADENVEVVSSGIGGSSFGSSGQNTGRMFVQLLPRKQRKMRVNEIMDRLRPQLGRVVGVRAFIQNPPMIRLGGRFSKSPYDFTLQGPDTEELYRQAQRLEPLVSKIPGLTDVTSDLLLRNPRVNIRIDRDKAAALHLDAREIQTSLYDAYGPRWISTIYAPKNQYHVLVELLPQYQANTDSLALLQLKNSEGHLVPLSTVTSMHENAGPQTINHSGQLPSVTVSFNIKPGVSLGDAVAQIKEVARNTLPGNITTSFQGTAAAFESSLKNLTLLLVIAILVVYIVLGVLYESYVHPITILSGLPSAGFGALITLIVFKAELNIYAFVGLMMLIGIVKKNAIMQIDFALECERREGKSPLDAIYEGCLVRFRPIMMTTSAALLGALPIALGVGAGGEARRGLGLAVVGGLVFSQTITLFLTPVVYTYMAALMLRIRPRKAQPAAAELVRPELSHS